MHAAKHISTPTPLCATPLDKSSLDAVGIGTVGRALLVYGDRVE